MGVENSRRLAPGAMAGDWETAAASTARAVKAVAKAAAGSAEALVGDSVAMEVRSRCSHRNL